ncbi:sensor histidine kinase [Metabacillus litoralis]|uniref:histidine kinase n=1 Tax=Metabacillus litoralis TaxID=152268 RepID=A0A5C6W7F1_9BACI|nr:sensor histidine kinase [Metabacillus litoralis]TXC91799.1 sensor histidine kinase [Metabacillus litoralis]
MLKKLIPLYSTRSFKTTIISLYLPVIIFFILLISWISYLLAASQIQENAYQNINDTVFQTKHHLENRLTDVFEQLVSLSNDPKTLSIITKDPSEITPEDYIAMDEYINRIYLNHNSMIESVLVDLHRGHFTLSKHDQQAEQIQFDYDKYMKNYKGSKEGFYWRNLHKDDVFLNKNSPNEVISVFKLIGNERSQVNGALLFNIRTDFFERVFNKSLIGDNGYLTLVSKEGYMKSKTVEEEYQLDETVLNYLHTRTEEQGQFEYQKPNGKKMIVIFDTLGVNKWKVAAVFPEEDILKKANYIKYLTIFVIMILIVIAVMIANVIAKFITEPISSLVKNIESVNEKNVHVDLPDFQNAPKEMVILNNGIKNLMTKINSLLNQVKLDQEEKRQLEFSVIHAQINPHFLYNTLYSIKGLCDMGMNKEASDMISALSTFFRISISKGKEIIKIKDEIEHIQNYLYIQEMRYGDDFNYTFDIDQRILSYQTVKLTLQPLIENAIYHGVKQSRGMGEIQIIGYEKENEIIFHVIDNGHGMNEQNLNKIRAEISNKHHSSSNIGIGLRSVHERMKIHFGDQYGLTFSSKLGEGTNVTVTIPKVRE